MIPIIDRRATGINLRRIMDKKNISVKDLKNYLGLGSLQSIYHWLNGLCLPSIDNLYAMSIYFSMPLDDLICGSHIRPYGLKHIFWEPATISKLTEHLHGHKRFYRSMILNH